MIAKKAGLMAVGLAVMALALSSGCGPAGEKIVDKVEKGVDAGIAAAFDAADTNNDGKITMEELSSAEKPHDEDTRETFKKLDRDGDGAISRGEFRKAFDELKQGFNQIKKEMREQEKKRDN